MSADTIDGLVLEARRLRSAELARLAGLAWRAPAALLHRVQARRAAAGRTGTAGVVRHA